MANPTPRSPAAKTATKAAEPVQTVVEQTPAAPLATLAAGPQTALDLPADLAAELAAEAKDDAAKERPAVSKISLKGGLVTYMGSPVPENKLDVVLLAGAYWNKWYAKKYNPNVIVNPNCFAVTAEYGDEPGQSENMEPHDNVENPVHENCNTCPKMQWGSAGTAEEPSRGKACKETRRLVMIPASALESVEAVQQAEIALVDVPVTSVQNYGNYINVLGTMKRPVYSVVTTLSTKPDTKSQFKVLFQPVRLINDRDILQALRERLDGAKRAASVPYDEAYLAGETDQKGTGQEAPVNTKKFSQ